MTTNPKMRGRLTPHRNNACLPPPPCRAQCTPLPSRWSTPRPRWSQPPYCCLPTRATRSRQVLSLGLQHWTGWLRLRQCLGPGARMTHCRTCRFHVEHHTPSLPRPTTPVCLSSSRRPGPHAVVRVVCIINSQAILIKIPHAGGRESDPAPRLGLGTHRAGVARLSRCTLPPSPTHPAHPYLHRWLRETASKLISHLFCWIKISSRLAFADQTHSTQRARGVRRDSRRHHR